MKRNVASTLIESHYKSALRLTFEAGHVCAGRVDDCARMKPASSDGHSRAVPAAIARAEVHGPEVVAHAEAKSARVKIVNASDRIYAEDLQHNLYLR